jgi:hypothetical protein
MWLSHATPSCRLCAVNLALREMSPTDRVMQASIVGVRSVLPMKISFILSFLLLGSFLLWFLLSSMHSHKTMDDAHHVGAAGEGTTGR